MQRLPSRAAHLSGPPCKRGYRGVTPTGVRRHPRGSALESKNNKVQSILCSHLAGRMVGLKLLSHKMKGEKGNHPYVVGVLFGFFLAVFPGSSACPKLCACYVPTEVHCTFRYLTTVPLHISQNVERINLGYNNLVKLTETDFSGLEKLELLMLHSNQIHTIQDKTFSDLHSLKILKMSYNQIKLIQADTFYGLVALVRLQMDHNKIEFVNPKALYGLTSLKLVHLEGNLLKQLHPDTFVTLRYLEVFRTSVIKHIYLSDNFLTSLPQDIFSYMSELESLYLHGNPWTCDCALKWFAKWAERHSDVVKCKKGREATDALQCPLCTNPRNSKEKLLTKIPLSSFNCSKPTVDTDLKLKTITVVDDGELTSVSPKDFMAPIGSMSLNLIDQTGNQANIDCNVQKPSKISPVIFKKTDNNTLLEISLSTFLKCSIDHDHIHQLWSILALYSDSPLKLRQEHLLTEMPSIKYKYKQIDSKNEELFTNIEAELTAEPHWLMQSQVSMQLDRTATTLNMLHIQYSIDAQIILPDDVPKPTKQMWAMILQDENSKTEHSVLVNGSVKLDCQAIGAPTPVTEWLLPDGTKVKAPYVSEDGRIVIEKSGKLLLHSADYFDTGLYHCIGTNYEDADVLTFRITVIDPNLKHNLLNGAQLSVFLGEIIDLPCPSTGVPDASINWVIPGNMILHSSFKNKHLFHNGTLKIQPTTGQDNGYFMCIIANKYGVDYLVYQVLVKRNLSKLQQLTKKDTQVDSEATEGSGNQEHDYTGQIQNFPSTIPAEVTTQASMQSSFTNYFIHNKNKNKYKEIYRTNRGKISRRFRGQKRFGLSTKRINSLHWATFLEKTRNITLLRRQENITVKPTENAFLSSKSSENEGEISGDDILAEEELMFLATRRPSKYTLREASGNVVTAKFGSMSDNYSSFATYNIVTEPEPLATSSMVMQSEIPIDQNWLNKPKPEMDGIGLERYQTLPTPPTLMEATMPSLFKEPNSATNTSNSFQRLITSEEGNVYFKSKTTVIPTVAITNNSQFIISHSIVEKPDLLAENAEKASKKSSHQVPTAAVSLSNNASQHGYIYSRKKIILQVSPGPAILGHQQIEVVKDSATHSPFPRWYSRRRKTFGRRRIIRPDRISNNAGHRFTFPRAGFVPESSSLTFPTEISIQTPSNISVESFTPQTFMYTSIKPPYPKSTISSHTVISSSNKINTDEVYEASTTIPFYSKSTQVVLQRKIKSGTHQAIPDIDPSANIPFTTNIHKSKLNLKSTFTKANISPFMIKSTIPSFIIHDVSSSVSNGEIPSHNSFVTSYIQKELLQKQSIIQAKPSSEIYVTDFHISGPTYKNSSIYETNVSKSDNQTDVPRDSVERIGENVSLLKDNPILSLSTTESPSLVPMYTFTTDLNKETDTTNNQLIHNPTTTVANKFSKLKIFRRQRKKGQRRRRPLQKSMSFHRNILVNKGFVTPFKNIIPSPIMKTMKNVTEPPSLILTELFSKFTTMDIVTVIPQPPILSTADIKRDNTFLATGQESLENAYNIKLPMELSSEKLSSTAPQFEMSLDTTKISTVLPDTSLVTTGPMFTKVLQTTRQADKESYQYVGLTATSKIQITKTALHVKKEINPQIPTNAIYMTTSPLVSQTRLIQTTQTTSSPRWGKISWQFPLSKIRDTGKPLITNTVLKSTQSSTLYTPLWKIDKKNYIKNWSERIDQVATTTNPEDLNSFYQTRLAKPRISGGKFAVFTVLANSDAFIPCEANGNPQPAIHWTKISAGSDASKNRHHNRFEILPNGTLSIQNVSIQDRGQYLCVAANQQGSDKLLVTLSVVTYPPRILGKSSRIITVHSGKPAFMRCAAEGHPIPSITWILANKTHISEFSVENEAVSLHSDGTLLIKKVSVYDRGIYTCTANNPIGSDTMAIRLQVIAAPPIILEDKKQLILETMGESLKFPCTVKGDPHPTVHWVLPDGTEMKPLHYLNGKVFLFPNGSLLIRSIVPSDSGKYECIATSSTGSERRVVLLQVERQDIIPRIGATSQRFTQLNFGNRLLLNCSATGEPKPRIMWRLPSKAVVDQWHRMGSRIHVYPNGSLVIESITEKDAGDYICVARNRMGDDLTLLKVSVTMKPAKIDHKEYFKKLVPYGKDFKVDCKASGSPEPEISWSLPDGTTINNAMQADDSGHMLKKYTVFDNGTLYFNKVGMMEEGDYTCHAQNTLGKDEMKVQIKVIAAVPRIRQNSKAYAKIKAGDNAFFDCDAIGEPKPKIFWLLPSNNMILASAQRYILHINGSLSIIKVRLLDAGEYICVARNSGGDETKVYKLDVISKPPLINGLYSNKSVIKATAIKHSKKQIACNAEGDPVPQIMWIMPDNIFLTSPYYGSRITVHRNGTLEIRNVRSSDTAEFICIARNDGGESMLVVHLEVLEILRRPIFRNPFNEKVIAKPGKTIFLNCSVDGNPRPEIIWILPNGTQLYTGIRTLRFYLGSNGTLVINRLSKADAGKYRCSAKNKVGYIEKLIILETGETPMIFIHSGGTIKSISGESLSLHCLAAGSPKPNIIWTLPSGFVLDRPQINGKYTLLENGTLLIRETNIHDRGNYMCKAQNYIGDSTVVVFVTIVGHSPRITKRPPRNIHTVAGLAIQLHCMAFGIPDPEITWELPNHSLFFTGIKGKLSGSEILHPQGMLIIHNPNSSDSGIYKCVAKNQFGKDFTVTYVQIISNRNKV